MVTPATAFIMGLVTHSEFLAATCDVPLEPPPEKVCPYCKQPHRTGKTFCSSEHAKAYKAEGRGRQ